MDCTKIGSLILALRKEKQLTQKEIALAMHISDKTISKWERGLGCPDVSLLKELSHILGVNIEKLLSGDLNPQETNGGNMKKLKFYVCPNCGNIINSTGEAEIFCCGRKLEALIAQPVDEAHQPSFTEVEDEFYITLQHEMGKQHYISLVAYVRFDQITLVKLYPEQNPELRLPHKYGGDLYVFCSQHGLQVLKRLKK